MAIRLARRMRDWSAELGLVRPVQTDEDHNFRYVVLSGAWLGLLDGGVLTYLPVFLARLGATPTMLSLLTSGPYLVGILTYVPGGAYAERHSDQVKLANYFSLLARSSYVLLALLPLILAADTIPLVTVVLWSVAAIPTSVFLPALSTVFQKAVSPRRRARMIGGRWALLTVVSAVCIPLVGIMSDNLPFPVGYQIAFLLSFAGAVMSVVHFSRLRLPPFTAQAPPQDDRLSIPSRVRTFMRPLAESRLFVRYNLATLVFRLAMFVPSSLFSLYWVNELSAADTWIGLRGGIGYVVLAVGYVLWGRWANKLGHRSMLLLCGIGLGLYTLLTANVPSVQWLLPVAGVWGISQSGLDIGLLDMMLAVCPEGRQPSFVAAANVLISLSAFLGPLLGAAIAQTLGLRHALWIGGGLEILGAILFLWLPRSKELLSYPVAASDAVSDLS